MQTVQKRRPRRQPTEAQKTKAAERRAAMRKLARQVSAMSKDERNALAARFGVVTIEGSYSCGVTGDLVLKIGHGLGTQHDERPE